MRKRSLITYFLLSGCVSVQATSHPCTLILKPSISNGRLTQTVVDPYTKASIQHLKLKLYAGGADSGLSRTLLNAQLDNPVVFSNLKPNTSYQVRAYAYSTTDDSGLISYDDTNSWTDITVGTDDRPSIATLSVKLIDRPFDGQSSSSLNVISGGYSALGPEGLNIPRVVSTFAGSTVSGHVDALGTAAQLGGPEGGCADANGNLYIAEYSSHMIRKISSSGMVTTLAGGGGAVSAGYADGIGTAAKFTNPFAVCVDGTGNLYVADSTNNLIRKVVISSGVVSTLAGGRGTTSAGYADGVGTAALFNNPIGITLDGSGNLYVAEFNNNLIRKIVISSGVVSTLAGGGGATAVGYVDGIGTAALFRSPRGIGIDISNTNLYVADGNNNLIRKIVLSTKGVSTVAGGGGTTAAGYADGMGTSAKFAYPSGVVSDALGNLYIADTDNQLIRKISSSGMVTTLAGGGGGTTIGYADGTGTAALFRNPRGLFLDSFGNIYVADNNNNMIRILR